MDESKIEIIKKISYYCQSAYTSIHLFNDLVEKRKLELFDPLLMKILEDITNMMNFYSQLKVNKLIIDNVNKKLELVVDGYTNLDYFYIKDVFEYEILPVVESIFNEIKTIIFNQDS